MPSSINLSAESVNLLKMRGQSDQQVTDFAALLGKANEQMDQQTSAKQVLSAMSAEELRLLQKSVSLADPIQVSSLSDEGARNLLAQPDRTGMVDLNNDGIVEVGAARTVSFPPVNAPDSVHKAWDKATENLSDQDKMILQLQMHHQVYGFNIEGYGNKQALSPQDQWSSEGWKQLIADARAALEFAVGMDGWSRFNLLKEDFLNNFENELSNERIV